MEDTLPPDGSLGEGTPSQKKIIKFLLKWRVLVLKIVKNDKIWRWCNLR